MLGHVGWHTCLTTGCWPLKRLRLWCSVQLAGLFTTLKGIAFSNQPITDSRYAQITCDSCSKVSKAARTGPAELTRLGVQALQLYLRGENEDRMPFPASAPHLLTCAPELNFTRFGKAFTAALYLHATNGVRASLLACLIFVESSLLLSFSFSTTCCWFSQVYLHALAGICAQAIRQHTGPVHQSAGRGVCLRA